jgi:hypothetical protein
MNNEKFVLLPDYFEYLPFLVSSVDKMVKKESLHEGGLVE